MSSKSQIKRRSEITNRNLEKLGNEIYKLVKAAEEVADKLIETEEKHSIPNYPGLNFVSIRNALCDLFEHVDQTWIPTTLATSGSGPWQIDEFDEFLQNRDIELFHMPAREINGLIIGTSGWSEDDLSEQIYNRSPDTLRIYSQELFVVGLIAQRDPYDFLDQKTIEEVGFNHPAIQFILNHNFAWPWPTDDSHESKEDWSDDPPDWDSDDWNKESVLMQLGYTAKAKGLEESERRRILRQAFESSTLPGVTTSEQRQRWGAKMSPRRLHAISNFLSWLIKLQGSEKSEAKKKWASDLVWLKKMFYRRTMRFTWPDVTSHQISTKLNPAAAWPFDTNRIMAASKSDSALSTSVTHGKLNPRHVLAVIIGNQPQDSVESAVKELRAYIKRNNLVEKGSTLIQADDLLFSLAGRMFINDSDLNEIVKKNLTT